MSSDEAKTIGLYQPEVTVSLETTEEGIDRAQVVTDSDLILVLGGDGTLLNAVHTAGIDQVPILAVNVGHLGFLTDVARDELYPALLQVLAGDYQIDQRMMLEVVLPNSERQQALNDVVIRHPMRLIHLKTMINGQPCINYTADGLIVSTPSGSTGYSLSCGGSIAEPHLNAILMTPISPHDLTVRPFIIHGDSEIQITIQENRSLVAKEIHQAKAKVLVDGLRETYAVQPNQPIYIRKADKTIQLIRSQRRNYYNVLREKLMFGEGVNRKVAESPEYN